jgi:IS605 OrfB family transposase
MERLLARHDVDIKNKDEVNKIREKFFEHFGIKDEAQFEHDVKAKYSNLPSSITNTLKTSVYKKYKSDFREIKIGKKSITSFKANMPLPVTQLSINLEKTNDKYYFNWHVKKGEIIKFGILFGKDPANIKHTVDKIIENESINDISQIKTCASTIQLKDNDLFFNLVISEKIKERNLDSNIVVGVDLGIVNPAVCALQNSENPIFIGNKDDYFKTSIQLYNRRKSLQKSIARAGGGHGRKKKLKNLNRLRNNISNFHTSYNHFISKQIINYAIKNNAGIIKIENLSNISKNKPMLLMHWPYYQLQSMITYKAEKEGIKVVTIKASYTSQTCSKCGYMDKDNRLSQDKFICKHCNNEINADLNAAINIANSTNIDL